MSDPIGTGRLRHRLGRRRFLAALASGLLAAPLATEAQQAGRTPRVGLLLPGTATSPISIRGVEHFTQGLREHGYVDGKNITIEYRYANLDDNRLRLLARELARLNVDVIVVGGTQAALAARQATNTIPIVVAVMADPVADGLVATLARPGGNITGVTFLAQNSPLNGCSCCARSFHTSLDSRSCSIQASTARPRCAIYEMRLKRVRNRFEYGFNCLKPEPRLISTLPSPRWQGHDPKL